MILSTILALPPTIILAILTATSTSAEVQWPRNVPAQREYSPEDEIRAKRLLEVKKKLQYEKPVGMRKMSTDEGAMFMLEDWIFASDLEKRSDLEEFGNGTCQADSPLRPLEKDDFFSRFKVRAALSKRQFACPVGTNSCSAMGAPDVCCGTDSDCVKVNDSPGVGSIGCCPKGRSCVGSISCDTSNGYSSCPGSKNGGCCIPGFTCAGIGCAAGGTSTTFPQPSTTPTPTPTSSSTAVIVVPTSPSTSPSPTLTSTSTSSPSSTAASTSTQAPLAPIRPTSGSMTLSSSVELCPVGFYVCSAYYPSGCCRVGRDCLSTPSDSCVLPKSTVLNSNGIVVVAPSSKQGAPSTASIISDTCIWTMMIACLATGIAMIAL